MVNLFLTIDEYISKYPIDWTKLNYLEEPYLTLFTSNFANYFTGERIITIDPTKWENVLFSTLNSCSAFFNKLFINQDRTIDDNSLNLTFWSYEEGNEKVDESQDNKAVDNVSENNVINNNTTYNRSLSDETKESSTTNTTNSQTTNFNQNPLVNQGANYLTTTTQVNGNDNTTFTRDNNENQNINDTTTENSNETRNKWETEEENKNLEREKDVTQNTRGSNNNIIDNYEKEFNFYRNILLDFFEFIREDLFLATYSTGDLF